MDNATPHGYEQSPTPYIPATPYLQITHACRGCSGSPHSVRLAETIANADGSVYGSESRYPDRADKCGE